MQAIVEAMLFVLCAIALMNITLVFVALRKIDSLHSAFVHYVENEIADELGNNEYGDYEEEMIAQAERERILAFESRIARMKEELANQQPPKPNYSSEAEILHPGVYNLPHDSVIEERNYDELEIAR